MHYGLSLRDCVQGSAELFSRQLQNNWLVKECECACLFSLTDDALKCQKLGPLPASKVNQVTKKNKFCLKVSVR